MAETARIFDPEVPVRVRRFLTAARSILPTSRYPETVSRVRGADGAMYDLAADDLEQLLERDADARTDGEQLAEACARYRVERDEARVRVAELELAPRCGATTPSVFENALPLGPCILNHGHRGMHQEASAGIPPVPGASWTDRNDPLAVAHTRIRELEADLGAAVSELRRIIGADDPETDIGAVLARIDRRTAATTTENGSTSE